MGAWQRKEWSNPAAERTISYWQIELSTDSWMCQNAVCKIAKKQYAHVPSQRLGLSYLITVLIMHMNFFIKFSQIPGHYSQTYSVECIKRQLWSISLIFPFMHHNTSFTQTAVAAELHWMKNAWILLTSSIKRIQNI